MKEVKKRSSLTCHDWASQEQIGLPVKLWMLELPMYAVETIAPCCLANFLRNSHRFLE